MTFKPMLAATIEDISKLQYPLLASPKLDGIRCLIVDGNAVSRNLKPIPNIHIRSILNQLAGEYGLDGEIMIKGDFNKVQSAVMSEDGEPDFYYAVFDLHSEGHLLFSKRLEKMATIVDKIDDPRVILLPQFPIDSAEELIEYESEAVGQDGHEGVMLRRGDTSYKYGRSTLNEGKLMKLKRFMDDEVTIFDFEPLYENNNTAVKNALGRTERSSHQANLSAKEMLGALHVRLKNGKEFKIGTGFDDATRNLIWSRRKGLKGKLVKFKYQELSADGIPRFPVYLGFRDPRDL
jgi:DNA ligase-1